MKRKLLVFMLCLLVLPVTSLAKEALPSPQVLEIDGQTTDLRGYNIDGYNYYKLRDLAYFLKEYGLDLGIEGNATNIYVDLEGSFDSEGHTYSRPSAKKDSLKKTMKLEVKDSGVSSNFEVGVYNIDGYNYFRLRELGLMIGFGVDYDKTSNTAKVFTKDPNPPRQDGTIDLRVILGNERILNDYKDLVDGKNVGLITNQTGIDRMGLSTVGKLKAYPGLNLIALYSPEHGLDGKTKAGQWVESYIDETYDLPVYSLYGKTRKPSPNMLKDIDVLLFDIQDIGSRTYTYISCMNYSMQAAKEAGIPFVVLDRPNPIGDKVEGFMLEEKYKTYVGVDLMPMSHGMTIGELAQYFNRNIGVDLRVVPMKNYTRDMVWQDTGLEFAQTSPNIPNIQAAFNYMATGSGENTGAFQSSYFSWIGKKGIDSNELAKRLNETPLIEGVRFIPEPRGQNGGVSLEIIDYKLYNPARVGYYSLATINQMSRLNVDTKTNGQIPMFEKIQGSDKMGRLLLGGASPEEVIASYQDDIEYFKEIRKPYLIYD